MSDTAGGNAPVRKRETPRKVPDADGVRRNARYSGAMTRKICARLAQGEVWHLMCRERGMPSYTTFYEWKKRYPDFAAAVLAAQEAAADYCADRALEVAQRSTKETVSRDRLEVDTLLQRSKSTKASAERAVLAEGKAERVEIVFRVRQFEKVIGPDGRAYVREVKPEDEA